MKMIVLNGAPRSGKDTFLNLINLLFGDNTETKVLTPFSYKDVLYSGVARRYGLTAEEVKILNADTITKDDPSPKFKGKSVRQALIYESENVIKKTFGASGVAMSTFNSLDMDFMLSCDTVKDSDRILITADGGFQEELDLAMEHYEMTRKDIFLVRMLRDGCTFDKDSRSYLENPDLVVDNNGSKADLCKYIPYIQEFIES
jgi:hypothetical protein